MTEETIKQILKFRDDRDWKQFHNPKDLAIGISTEANELLDIFRFKNEEEMKKIMNDEIKRRHVEEELADVLFFVLRFAQMNHMDLKDILTRKIQKNGQKYPADEVRGKNFKYNEYK